MDDRELTVINSKSVQAKRKPRGPILADQEKELPPGKASAIAAFIREIISWGKVDRDDINALEARLQQYLDLCQANDMKISNLMCYMALGIDKNIAFDWRHGRSRTMAHADFIKKVQIICGGFREALMLDGQINPVTGIFWQKNYDGLKDIQDVVITPNNPLGETVSAEELRRKYLDTIVDDYSTE